MKPSILIKIVICFVAILSIVQIAVSNRLSTTGIVLGKMEDELRLYTEENSLLKEKVLLASSLIHLASSAAELGFVQEKSQMVLIQPLPLAIKQ